MSSYGTKRTSACALHMSAFGVKRTLPWARPHLAFDPSGPPLFTLGYSLQAYQVLLHFWLEP